MNLSNVRIVLRERDNLEILDLAMRFILALDLRAYLRVAALVLLPAFLGCAALRYVAGWEWPLVWLATLAVGAFVEGPFTVVAGRVMLGEPTPARAVLAQFARRLVPYTGALLIAHLGIAAGALLVIVWVVPWARSAFVYEATLLEREPAWRALSRASQLSVGSGGRTLGLLLALALAVVGGVVVAELLGQAVVGFTLQLEAPFGALFAEGGSAYALAGYLVTRPFVATARFLAYIDQRTRRDGWELQVRFMDLAAAAGAPR